MAVWVKEQLKVKNRPKLEGCNLAVIEFGSNHPFSNSFIYQLECLKEFKDFRKQKGGRTRHVITKYALHKKIDKIVDESEGMIDPLYQSLISLSKEF